MTGRPRKDPHELLPKIYERKCLNCDVGFSAPTKFHRLCPECRKLAKYRSLNWGHEMPDTGEA